MTRSQERHRRTDRPPSVRPRGGGRRRHSRRGSGGCEITGKDTPASGHRGQGGRHRRGERRSGGIAEPDIAEGMRKACEGAIPAGSFAGMVAFAMSQPNREPARP
ncbi:hypothetical protein GDR74_07280 [Microvirga thermotolerans]|uniref:Uncharacterized protein n=1 Tax=Microvirga thermotolerans TaxID=2651334 RepID=A0A5P9JUE0_9HYPH|nr:hypothetical protein GDR74_07280 [Microvirga thermotolerans]